MMWKEFLIGRIWHKSGARALVKLSLLALFTTAGYSSTAQRQLTNIDTLVNRIYYARYAHSDSSRKILQQLTDANKTRESKFIESQLKFLRARLLSRAGKNDSARLLLNECESFFNNHSKYQFSSSHGHVLLAQSRISQVLKEFGLSNIAANEARAIFRRSKEAMGEASALAMLGNNCLLLHDNECALKHYLQAQKIRMQNNFRLDHNIIINLGIVYNAMGQYDNALRTVREGLKLDAVRNNAPRSFVSLYSILGTTFFNLKEFDSAQTYYEKSHAIAKALALPDDINRSKYRLALFYQNVGNLKKCRSLLRSALQDTFMIYDNEVQLLNARNYFELNQTDSCILAASTMLRFMGENNKTEAGIQLAALLSKAYERKNLRDSVIAYLIVSSALKDSVYGPRRQQATSSLFAEMETLTKQKEIKLLQKQSELTRAENNILIISIVFGSALTILGVGILVLNYLNRKRKQELLNYELRQQLELRRNELHQQMMRILYINDGLAQVEEKLKKLKGAEPRHTQAIQQALNTIHLNRTLEKEWDHFDNYFGNVHRGFFENLQTRFPGLSILERRLAGLVRMDLTNSEIAGILNIEGNSVKVAKHRLKKKIGLKEEDDLNIFLQSIDNNSATQSVGTIPASPAS